MKCDKCGWVCACEKHSKELDKIDRILSWDGRCPYCDSMGCSRFRKNEYLCSKCNKVFKI